MSRDKNYQRLLNDKQWKLLRAAVFRRTNGLCEMCMKEGHITPGVDVHHIRPVEQAKTVEGPDGMRARCYDPNNVMLLCVPCHIKTHQEMRSHTPEKVRENKKRRSQRFLEMNDPNYQPPEQPKPYGQQADEYLKNLEERARLENLNDPNYKQEDNESKSNMYQG